MHRFLYLQLLFKSSSSTLPSAALEKQKFLVTIGFFPIKLLIGFFFLVNLTGHVLV